MSNAIIWTQEGCPLCDKVKQVLSSEGYEERPASELISGDKPNNEALVQLAMQDMELPIVNIDGAYVDVHQFLSEHGIEAA